MSFNEDMIGIINTASSKWREKNKDQNIDIIFSYFGLNGKKSIPMEEIGKSYGLTRESIRQTLNRKIGSNCNQIQLLKSFNDALSLVYKLLPTTNIKLDNLLKQNGLISNNYSSYDLLKLARWFGIDNNIEFHKLDDNKTFFISKSDISKLSRLLSATKKQNSKNGAVCVSELLKQLKDKNIKINRNFILEALYIQKNIEWLDDKNEWFYYSKDNKNNGYNRILQRLKKMFCCANEIDFNDVVFCLNRSLSKNETENHLVLSKSILKSLIVSFFDVSIDSNNIIYVNKMEDKSILTDMERRFVEHILTCENFTSTESSLEALIDSNTERYNFSMTLNFSPIVIGEYAKEVGILREKHNKENIKRKKKGLEELTFELDKVDVHGRKKRLKTDNLGRYRLVGKQTG